MRLAAAAWVLHSAHRNSLHSRLALGSRLFPALGLIAPLRSPLVVCRQAVSHKPDMLRLASRPTLRRWRPRLTQSRARCRHICPSRPFQKYPSRSLKKARAFLSCKWRSTADCSEPSGTGPPGRFCSAERRGPFKSKPFPLAIASCKVRSCRFMSAARCASDLAAPFPQSRSHHPRQFPAPREARH